MQQANFKAGWRRVSGIVLLTLMPVALSPQVVPGPGIETILVADGTPVHLVLMDDLQGKRLEQKQSVHFKVREDIEVGSTVVVKTGATALGHIESVSKSGLFGKSGKLVLQFDYVESVAGAKIPLRGGAAVGGGKGGALTLESAMWYGPNANLPVGTVINAYVDKDQHTPQAEHSKPSAGIIPSTETNVVSTASPSNQTQAPPDSSKSGMQITTVSATDWQSIESACSGEKGYGTSAYHRCLQGQLANLTAAPPLPSFSGVSETDRESIESACSNEKDHGTTAYGRCLQGQLASLAAAPPLPNFSGVSATDRQSIESACSADKVHHGAAAYRRCLQDQLVSLAAAPPVPSFSSVSAMDREAIESFCSTDRVHHGAAAYHRCLQDRVNQLSPQIR
jgi:hypothetical protein